MREAKPGTGDTGAKAVYRGVDAVRETSQSAIVSSPTFCYLPEFGTHIRMSLQKRERGNLILSINGLGMK
jgi:hypothetical protein